MNLATDTTKYRVARLRKKLGVTDFSDVTPTGQPNEDYLEPFRGLKGIKHMLSFYLMKSVPFVCFYYSLHSGVTSSILTLVIQLFTVQTAH